LWRSVQVNHRQRFARYLAFAVPFLAMAVATGCAQRGITLDSIAADRSLVTGATNGVHQRTDPVAVSDEATIRNLVSAADLEGLAVGETIGWTNSRTGSRGRVTDIVEFKEANQPCRRFRTTRESFDGVAVYSGEACLLSGNEWTMLSFERL
jgi:surface antigen